MSYRDRRQKEQNRYSEDQSDDRMVTYADTITLLMAFFIMLVSFSTVDLPTFEQVQAGIQEYVGGTEEQETPIYELHEVISTIVQTTEGIPTESIDVAYDDQGIVIDFASGSFFQPGTAQITEEGQLVLKKIKRDIEEPPFDLFMIDVEGHTDSDPVSGEGIYPSNWELSAARAASVVRHFTSLGLDEDRLKASGYAHTKPKYPEKDIMGLPIAENKRLNRRVSIRLFPGFLVESF